MLHCRAVKEQRDNGKAAVVLVGTRVPPDVRDLLKARADREKRSVSGHLRFLIERDLERDLEKAA